MGTSQRSSSGVALRRLLFSRHELGHVAYLRNKLRITAKQLQLRNVNQLAAVTKDSKTYMGRLDSVIFSPACIFANIGGTVLTLDHDQDIEIRRTSSAEALAVSVEIQEDIAEGLAA
jgi:hypothetical protein